MCCAEFSAMMSTTLANYCSVKMKSALLSRFQGAMVGAVVGDCLGSPFEGTNEVKNVDVTKYFAETLDYKRSLGQQIEYTDDTAMARSVAASLIDRKGLDLKDMAQRFAEEYFREPDRGYGGTVINVFSQLRNEDYKDPHGPAKCVFQGQGSSGNGAAMRIAPLALYGFQMDNEKMISIAADISRITHSHLDGVNSGILQCLAVRQALRENCEQPIDSTKFIENLYGIMNHLDGEAPRRPKCPLDEKDKPFCEKLKLVSSYVHNEDISAKDIVLNLGNNVLGLGSVPTAILCFLKGFQELRDFETDNPFERTIRQTVALGGDTDTIASMAGAMAGAYWGIEKIPKSWQDSCESVGIQGALNLAKQLYQLHKQV